MPRLKSMIAKRTLFVKVQATITLLCIIPIIIGLLAYSSNVRDDLFENLDTMASMSLKSTMASSEVVLNTVQDISSQLYEDSSVHHFLYQGVGQDRDSLGQMVARIKQLMTSSRYIRSVYLVSTRQSVVYSTSYGISTVEDSPDTAFLEWFDHNYRLIDIIETHRISLGRYSESTADVLSIFTKLPMDGALQPAGCLVINVDANLLYDDLVQRSNTSENSTLLVLNSANEVILAQPSIELYQNITQLIPIDQPLDGGQGSFVVEAWGRSHLLAYNTLPGLGWKFVELYPLEQLNDSLAAQNRYMAIICVLLFLFSFVVSFAMSNETTKPFDELANLLREKLPPPAQSTGRAGVGVFKDGLAELIEDSESMKQQLDEAQPVLKERFLANLLIYRKNDLPEIVQGLAQYGVELPCENLVLCVIQIKQDYSVLESDFLHMEMMGRSMMAKVLEQLEERHGHCLALTTQDSEIVLLLDGAHWSFEQVHACLGDIPALVEYSARVDIYACIYDHPLALTEVSSAYLHVQWALDYYALYNGGGILLYTELDGNGQDKYLYPYEKEGILANCIRASNREGALNALRDLMDAFYAPTGAAQADTFIALTHLHSGMLRLLHELNLPLEVISSWSGMAGLFLKLKSRKAVERLFAERITELIGVIQLRRNDRQEIYYQKILEYIDRNYSDSGMSLEQVSEEIHISVSYINQILKNCGSKSFNQLLSNVRISNACKLLMETDMKIKNIAQSVGYSSAKYFIYVFKEYTGVTPGSYRSMPTEKSSGAYEDG